MLLIVTSSEVWVLLIDNQFCEVWVLLIDIQFCELYVWLMVQSVYTYNFLFFIFYFIFIFYRQNEAWMSVNMLLYWMYAIRLNAPQQCAWQNKNKTKPKQQQSKNKNKTKQTKKIPSSARYGCCSSIVSYVRCVCCTSINSFLGV